MNTTSNDPPPVCRRVIYRGRVQGVGFRYTTAAIARKFPVSGYVRNLPDRTVELVAEGLPHVLESFQQEIASTFAGNIERADCEEIVSDGGFAGFRIRY